MHLVNNYHVLVVVKGEPIVLQVFQLTFPVRAAYRQERIVSMQAIRDMGGDDIWTWRSSSSKGAFQIVIIICSNNDPQVRNSSEQLGCGGHRCRFVTRMKDLF